MRPKLTAAQEFLHGHKSKARATKTSAYTAGRPKPPSHLSSEARLEWTRVSKLLGQRGTETPGDYAALAIYSECYSRWVQAKRELGANLMVDEIVLDSNGGQVTKRTLNPLLKIVSDCERRLLLQLKSLGLTPGSRESVQPAQPDVEALPAEPGTIGWRLLHHGGNSEETED